MVKLGLLFIIEVDHEIVIFVATWEESAVFPEEKHDKNNEPVAQIQEKV